MRPTGLQKQTSKQTKQWLLLKVAILYVYKKNMLVVLGDHLMRSYAGFHSVKLDWFLVRWNYIAMKIFKYRNTFKAYYENMSGFKYS